MTTTKITNRDDIIDSRDIIERIKELEEARDAECDWFRNTVTPKPKWCCNTHMFESDITASKHPKRCEWAGLDEDDANELETLQELAIEGSNAFGSDWEYGVTLINDDYFEDYAQELAESIGAIDRNAGWPLGCIDWEQAADELRVDYSSIEFDGETYWGRA